VKTSVQGIVENGYVFCSKVEPCDQFQGRSRFEFKPEGALQKKVLSLAVSCARSGSFVSSKYLSKTIKI
jgi:hypothetical protein